MKRAVLRRLTLPIARAPYTTKPHTPRLKPKSKGSSSKSASQALPRRASSGPKSDKSNSSEAGTVSSALSHAAPENNDLLAPVHIPEDPNGVLNERHPATKILANSSIVVQRQLELVNLMMQVPQDLGLGQKDMLIVSEDLSKQINT